MPKPVVNLPGEIWKPVVGYEGTYAVSSLGRVKAVARTVPAGSYGGTKAVPGGMKARRVHRRTGYESTTLRYTTKLVHRLVLEAFVGPCPDGMEACHNNGDRGDNRLSNLRWDTRKSNHADKKRHGTSQRGERNGWSKLTTRAVVDILTGGQSLGFYAAKYGVTRDTVSKVRQRRLWKHVVMPVKGAV